MPVHRKDTDDKVSLIRHSIKQALQKIQGQSLASLRLESYRAAFDAAAAISNQSHDVRIETLLVNDLPAEWIFPTPSISERTILYFHSGTFIDGSLQTDRNVASMLASITQTKVLQIAYRIAPEKPFPTAVYDGLAAYQWLIDHGHTPHHIALVGSVAGGGIALATLLLMRDHNIPFPALAACISPWIDLTQEGLNEKARITTDIIDATLLAYAAGHYVRPEEAALPLASPLHADLCGLPPLLLLVGEHDIFRQEAQHFVKRVKACQGQAQCILWGNMFYGWTAFAHELPTGTLALEQIAAYFEKYFALIDGNWPDDTIDYHYKPYYKQ